MQIHIKVITTTRNKPIAVESKTSHRDFTRHGNFAYKVAGKETVVFKLHKTKVKLFAPEQYHDE